MKPVKRRNEFCSLFLLMVQCGGSPWVAGVPGIWSASCAFSAAAGMRPGWASEREGLGRERVKGASDHQAKLVIGGNYQGMDESITTMYEIPSCRHTNHRGNNFFPTPIAMSWFFV